jgi:protein tyrosine phosphatase (PTP) superfamily phosphohydrolase (DUF442 family)
VKEVPLSVVKDDLSRYLREAARRRIVITRRGKPAGARIGFESDEDRFDYRRENDRRFLARIEKARGSIRAGHGVGIEEVERCGLKRNRHIRRETSMLRIFLLSLLLAAPACGGERTDTIRNFHKVHDWLYRGGRPDREDVAALRDLGVKTIVDLERTLFDPEPSFVATERARAAESGIRFVHVPMHPIGAPAVRDVERVLALFADPSNRPLYVHCNRGSDRTGIVVAACRMRFDGWTVRQAREELKRYGHRTFLLFWWKNRLKYFIA